MMRILLSVSLLAMFLGCSGNPSPTVGVTVKGKILKDGQPLAAAGGKLPPGEWTAEVAFVPASGGTGEREPLQADGTFEEKGAGNGVQPGKYRLAVFHYVAGRGSDGLGGKFSEAASPIEIDIPADKTGSTHDLGTIELGEYMK